MKIRVEETEMAKLNRLRDAFFKFPVLIPLIILAVPAAVLGMALSVFSMVDDGFYPIMLLHIVVGVGVICIMLFYPVVLTLLNLVFLVFRFTDERAPKAEAKIELVTTALGVFLSLLYIHLDLASIRWVPWSKAIVYGQLHSPVDMERIWLPLLIMAIATVAYVFLRKGDLSRWPPLTGALALGSVYLGAIVCGVWIAQIVSNADAVPLALLPFNFIIFTLRTVKRLLMNKAEAGEGGAFCKISDWPLLGLWAALPVLGIVLAFNHLLGGSPSDLFKVWTETADWTFSRQIPPPSLEYRGHYLCTVAARGHSGLVRPQRLGRRRGEIIVVNRQLCVANAFEQLIEERAPRFHRAVRNFYDSYGLPIARLINRKWEADLVYIIMKPAEWLFLIVLYLFDVQPEKRISAQYR